MDSRSLKRILTIDNKIKQLSIAIDGMKVISERIDQKSLDKLLKNRESLIREKEQLQDEAMNIIMQMEQPKQQSVLILRYINCLSWKGVADDIGYTNMRSMFQLHVRALKSFEKIAADQE